MSAKARRRRPKSSGSRTRQAFEDDENNDQLNAQETNEESNTTSNTALSNNPSNDQLPIYEQALFTINNLTVEVTLDHDILTWKTVPNGTTQDEIVQRKLSAADNSNSVNLHEVYAIAPIHYQWNAPDNNSSTKLNSNSSEVTTQLRGFELHTYERMTDNVLQEIVIIFQSISPNQIEQWYQMLSRIIVQYKPPKNIFVICNPYSGERTSRNIYNVKLRPMLDRARYNITYSEIDDYYTADDVLNNFQGDFETIYGLVIIGGDGSVINTINSLINHLAKENQTKLDSKHDLPMIPFPICIIPTGTTNLICHSIHGNTDPCTPLLHLLYNKRMKIDMSAIFDINHNYVTANFNAGAGFPATALQYFSRYPLLNSKKVIQKSFAKAASNKNLKSIDMEIRYIPAEPKSSTLGRCYNGCSLCTPAPIEEVDNQVKAFDDAHLKKKDKRKKSSSKTISSSSKQNDDDEKNWKTIRRNYLQIAVLTNASLWSFAPQGLSKYGHLADGLLDLVLIESTTRKEFIRYLKRNGNSKDQYEFPFTHLIKVKEIEIELKLLNNFIINDMTNSNKDQCDSSISDEEENISNQKYEPHPPSAPPSDSNRRHRRRQHQQQEQEQEQEQKQCDTDIENCQQETFNPNGSFRRRSIFKSLKLKKDKIPLPRPSSACGNEPSDEKQHRKNQRNSSGTLRPSRSFLNLFMGNNATSVVNDYSSTRNNNINERRASVMSRSSTFDNNNNTNSQYQAKKQACLWNLDFTPYNSPLIRIKCFYRFLPVFGLGLDPDTLIKEVNYSCFG